MSYGFRKPRKRKLCVCAFRSAPRPGLDPLPASTHPPPKDSEQKYSQRTSSFAATAGMLARKSDAAAAMEATARGRNLATKANIPKTRPDQRSKTKGKRKSEWVGEGRRKRKRNAGQRAAEAPYEAAVGVRVWRTKGVSKTIRIRWAPVTESGVVYGLYVDVWGEECARRRILGKPVLSMCLLVVVVDGGEGGGEEKS